MIPTLAIAIASMSGYAAANMMGGISGKVTSGVGSATYDSKGDLVYEQYKGGSEAKYMQTQDQLARNGLITMDDGRVVKASDVDIQEKGNQYTMKFRDEETGDIVTMKGSDLSVSATDENGITRINAGNVSTESRTKGNITENNNNYI